jgi:hypothetical protein
VNPRLAWFPFAFLPALFWACPCQTNMEFGDAGMADSATQVDAGSASDAAVPDAGDTDAGKATDGGKAADAGVSTRDGGGVDAGALQWFPGNYLLLNGGQQSSRDQLLGSPLMSSFVGMQIEYDWSVCEGAEGDYDAGYASLDSDLATLAAHGKKLILMMQYKQFSGTLAAVPAYLLGPGPWCVQTDGGSVCGQYQMGNGRTAMIWQGLGTGGVADRLQAWFAAFGAHVAQSAYRDTVAGVVLPESACSEGTVPLANVGYMPGGYLSALEADTQSLADAFHGVPAFQYINFISQLPSAQQTTALQQFADWALLHPTVGLGCPDVATQGLNSPGYPVLMNPKYQGVLPYDVAVESPDYASARASSLDASYALAVSPAPNGMAAQIVVWADVNSSAGNVFTIQDVANYLPTHPDPNTAPPTW